MSVSKICRKIPTALLAAAFAVSLGASSAAAQENSGSIPNSSASSENAQSSDMPGSSQQQGGQQFQQHARSHGPNVVVFGDSVIADPTIPDWAASQATELLSSSSLLQSSGSSDAAAAAGWERCPNSSVNYGKIAARRLNLAVDDFSCAGASTLTGGVKLRNQIDRAIDSGALNGQTQRVVLTIGFNDTYTNRDQPASQVKDRYIATMVTQMNRVKRAAPNARIQHVGYPTVFDRNGNVCLVRLAPGSSGPIPAGDGPRWEAQAQRWQRESAHAADIEFLDAKPATANRHICASDQTRVWAGVIDFYGGMNHLPGHLNPRGHHLLADLIVTS